MAPPPGGFPASCTCPWISPSPWPHQPFNYHHKETDMNAAIDLLFTSGIGLLSLFTILFIIGMGFFMVKMVKRKMNEPEE
jgi:hypothetical protein